MSDGISAMDLFQGRDHEEAVRCRILKPRAPMNPGLSTVKADQRPRSVASIPIGNSRCARQSHAARLGVTSRKGTTRAAGVARF